MNAQEHQMPFGKHKSKPLGEIPDGYLLWIIRECKLSSGLRAAVGDELRRRNIETPTPPPLQNPPQCQYCGKASDRFSVTWQEDRRGQRRIRAACGVCGRYLCFLPVIPPWIEAANDNASETPILDALLALDALGIELRSDGKTVWFSGGDCRRVPAEVQTTVRQCSHQLAGMIGRKS